MPNRAATLIVLAAAALLGAPSAGTAAAADLPAFGPRPTFYGDPSSGGGFSVARVPLRPAPLRFDIYGYPLLGAVPSPLAVGNGCPPALQPDYDADGNFAGYAPLPMCR